MSNKKPDYVQYFERLRSYNDPQQWAGEPNVYIKDLVEAGFVYTGHGDLVFCFKCGLTVSNWKEDDNPIDRHREKSQRCPFLLERLRKLSAATSPGTSTAHVTSHKSLQDFERESVIYDWVSGQGVIPRDQHKENERNGNVLTSSSTISSLANSEMRSEKKRYESFALCPVNKHWPSPESLSSAGFYYMGTREDMRCFCCGVQVDGWESSDQDALRKHRALHPSCAFILGMLGSEVESECRMFDQLSLKSSNESTNTNHTINSNKSSVQPITPTQDTSIPAKPAFVHHRVNTPNTQANYVANPTHLPVYPNKSSFQNNVNPMLPAQYPSSNSSSGHETRIPTAPPNLHQQHHQVYTATSPAFPHSSVVQNIPPTFKNNYAPQSFDRYNSGVVNVGVSSINGGLPYGVSSNGISPSANNSSYSSLPSMTTLKSLDWSDVNKRLETFFTWPRTSSFLQPKDLAEAGFVYTGKGDGVSCYKCKILLKRWEPGDTAWSEHQRWSPVCPLVIERLRQLNRQQSVSGDVARGNSYHRRQDYHRASRETFSSLNENILREDHLYGDSLYGSSRSLPLPSSVESSPGDIRDRQYSFGDLPTKARYNQSYYTDDYRSSGIERTPVPDVNPALRISEQHVPGKYFQSSDQRTMFSSQNLKNKQQVNGVDDIEQSKHQPPEYYPSYIPQKNEITSIHPPPQSHKCTQSSVRHDVSGNEGKVTKNNINQLIEMGFNEEVIHNTITCYNEYAPNSFNNLNDLAQAVLYFQQYGHLEGTPFGKNLNVDPSKDGENMICKRVENYHPITTEKNGGSPQDGDRQCCKICMDNDVEVTFVPCGHLILCESCALGRKECPICRLEVKETVRTYYFGN